MHLYAVLTTGVSDHTRRNYGVRIAVHINNSRNYHITCANASVLDPQIQN